MILAIAKKEIRHYLILMLAGLCMVSVGYCHVLSTMGLSRSILGMAQSGYVGPMPLVSERQLFVAILYVVLGLALGLVPTLNEADPSKKTWGILLRLPMSRGRLLLGKVLGGVAMYSIAGGVPLVFAVVWAAIPGHYPGPFRIGMAAPAFVDLLNGLVFYFACLLLGTRSKRGLVVGVGAPVVAAGSSVLVVFLVHGFFAAVLIQINVMALLYWAAHSTFARWETWETWDFL